MDNPAPHGHPAAESGSVLVYIFIAIVALAALTFAVSQNNREGLSTVNRERSELLATQILDYAGMVRRVIQVMQVDAVADSDICFHSPRWGHADYNHAGCTEPRYSVFAPTGGGGVWQEPSADIFDASKVGQTGYGTWLFSGANQIFEVGTDCALGDASCNELIMVLPYINRDICLALNKRLQIDNAAVIPLDDPNFNISNRYNGQYIAGQIVNAATLHGKRSGCFQTQTTPANGSYVFYAVLIAR